MNNTPQIENHLDHTTPKWFAIYTKSKCEKSVEKKLIQKGIKAYLPTMTVVKRYNRKIKRSQLPLIKGYVFVKITKQQYLSVLQTDHVVYFVQFSRNLISIPEWEIETLRKVVGEVRDVALQPLALEPGISVEIMGGNLTGLQGRLVKENGHKLFLVDLNTLGLSLQMNIHQSLLRPVYEPAAF